MTQQTSSKSPHIQNQKVIPSTIELDRNLNPDKYPIFQAEVIKTDAKIKDVELRFLNPPLKFAMKSMDGNLWQAELTPDQTKALSMAGKSTRLEAVVVAQDENGNIGRSKAPLTLSVNVSEKPGQAYAGFTPPPTAPLPSLTASDVTTDGTQDAQV